MAPAFSERWAVLSLQRQPKLMNASRPAGIHGGGGEGHPPPSYRRRWCCTSSLPHAGRGQYGVASPYSFTRVEEKEEVHHLPLLTPSCRHCISRCSPSAAAPPSVWWRSYWRWSAKNCKCWQSSGRFLGGPDTQQRAGP